MPKLGATNMIKKPTGFVAITSVLIIASVTIAIAITVSLLGIGEGQSSLALSKGDENLHFVEGCVEDYLLKIRNSSSFAGGNITRPEGTCTITINSGNPNWDITVSSLSTTYQRRVQVIFVRNSTGITLTSWKEV